MSDLTEYREEEWYCPHCATWTNAGEEGYYLLGPAELHLDCALAQVAENLERLKKERGTTRDQARGILQEAYLQLGGTR